MNPLVEKALWTVSGAILGALFALVAAYFTLGKSISNDLHFVRGQLVMILQQLAFVQRVRDAQVEHDKDLVKLKADLNHAHDKLRDLHRRSGNGDASHT